MKANCGEVAESPIGKTTAVRAWCDDREAALAWVTLDSGDNDPVRLWRYLAESIDRVREDLGRGALRRLWLPGVAVEDALDDLANGLATSREADDRLARPRA